MAGETFHRQGRSVGNGGLEREAARRMHDVAIYVSDHCGNCSYAWEIAALIREEFPQIALKVIDLDAPGEPVPETVFATPTYLLDDRVWSLGNPSPQQVRETLKKLE